MNTHAISHALGQYTGFLLRRAYARSAECAQACIGEDGRVRDAAVLSILAERGSQSQRQLGDLMHVNRSVMVKLVDELERRSWVVRARNAADRRSYALELTDCGRARLAELDVHVAEGDRRLTEVLSEPERKRLNELLLQLLEDDPCHGVAAFAGRTGYLIAQAHRQVRGWAIDGLKPLGVDPRGFGVLATLGREQPCSQNHVAARLGVSPPAVLIFIDELEAAGLVRRTRNAADRRVYDLTLTEAGTSCLERADMAAATIQAEVAVRLGKAGDGELRRLLMKVLAAPSG